MFPVLWQDPQGAWVLRRGPPWHQPCAVAVERGAEQGEPEDVGTVTQEGRSGSPPVRLAPSTSPAIPLGAGHHVAMMSLHPCSGDGDVLGMPGWVPRV